MAGNDRHNANREAATDGPARGSKWIWIIGAVFLVIIGIILVRGIFYAAAGPSSEQSVNPAITETDRALSGVEDEEASVVTNAQ